MTLEDLKSQFRSNEIDQATALQMVAPFLKGKTAKQAEAFVNEIIGLPSEPEQMTATERKTARGWEKNYRAK